jgi:hypothetical protein
MSFLCPDSYGVRGNSPADFPNPSNEAQKIGVHLDLTPDDVAWPAQVHGKNHPQGETTFAFCDFKCAAYLPSVSLLWTAKVYLDFPLDSPDLQSLVVLCRVRVGVVGLN